MKTFGKIVLFVVLVLGSFSYLAFQIPQQASLPPEEAKFDPAEVRTKQDLVTMGQTIFFGKGQCALCHSIGPSETARCPNLQGIGAKLSRAFIYESLTQPQAYIYMDYNHSPPKPFAAKMPAINKPPIGLNDNELLAVIAFLQSQGGEVTVDPSELRVVTAALGTGDARRGEQIYQRMQCAGCHTFGPGGRPGAVSLAAAAARRDLGALRAAILNAQIKGHQNLDARLSVRDLDDLLTYLGSLPPSSRT